MSTKFNRIIFDYDGTIIIHDKETEGEIIANLLNIPSQMIPEFVRRLNHLFENSYGRYFYENRKITYKLFYSIIERLMNLERDFRISAKHFDEVVNYKSTYMSDLAPNALDTLEYLKEKGYTLCVFTNGFYKEQAENMRVHGVLDYFDRIYAWDDFYAKPDERAVIRALGGTDPRHNVMVGDSIINDITPAKNLGIYTIGINIFEGEEKSNIPDRVITNLKELKNIL